MIEFVGWFGSILFALCALPQALKCWNDGHARGLSNSFLWLWLLGEASMIVYTVFKLNGDLPLLFNYMLNMSFLMLIMRYKYWPRKVKVATVTALRFRRK